ncbi:ribonuclease III domain-containing protein [Xylariaceae sp. FL0016]|nr:ribonuclease III domain-containing protein [Xylariaceae sp. FL0016]
MSKRSFGEFSQGTESLDRMIRQADELLKAVEALKDELVESRGREATPDEVQVILMRRGQQILPAAQALVSSQVNKSQKLDEPAVLVPNPVSLTQWNPEDLKLTELPKLPPAMDPVLEMAALTHPGMANRPGEMNYERLEWIGDAYLYLISSSYIYQTFPDLAAGRCSQLRERLIKNDTLSEFTVKYGIDKRARLSAEFDLNGRIGGNTTSQKNKKKVLGDIFESYVAAAIMGDANGLLRVSSWLKSLWSKTLRDEIRKEFNSRSSKSQPPPSSGSGPMNINPSKVSQQNISPKVLLSKSLGTTAVKISYKDLGEPKTEKHSGLPWYSIGVYYDGLGERDLLLGHGHGLSKKDAGAKAAQNALDNKKLMKRLQKKKADFDQKKPPAD